MRHRSPVGALASHGCGRAGAHDRVTGLESNGLDSETKTATRYLRGPESRTAVRRLQRRADRQTRGRAMPLGARLNASALVAATAVAQTLGVIDFLCIHDKATISEGAFSVAESPVRPPEALL
jgi:hypothetical protein